MGITITFLILLAIFIWLLPIIIILRSDKADMGEKFIWILLAIFFSWFIWIAFLLIAPVKQRA